MRSVRSCKSPLHSRNDKTLIGLRSQPRPERFGSKHELSGCKEHDGTAQPDDPRFRTNISAPITYRKVHKYLQDERQKHVNEALAYVKRAEIDDAFVASVMDDWDVVPNSICQVFREAGYVCFSEEDVKARDLAEVGTLGYAI